MVGEAIAGLGAIKTAFDVAKGLKDINDAALRNAAVIELQEHILTAQQTQSALTERIGNLEEEMAAYKTWEAQKNRYQLTDYGGGTYAYELKETEADGEPPHKICANCYQKSHKSILQNSGGTYSGRQLFDCTNCGSKFYLGDYKPYRGGNRTTGFY